MDIFSKDIEKQKKYIRENFKSLKGYITPKDFEQEKKDNIIADASYYGDSKYQHLSEFFFEWCGENRQRSMDFFGTDSEYYLYLNPENNADDIEEIYEDRRSFLSNDLPSDNSERRVWSDEGLMETELEYLHRVCYMDYLEPSDYLPNDNEEDYIILDNKITKGEHIKMMREDFNKKLEDANENNLEVDKFDDYMMKYHMLQQVYSLLFKDDNMEEYRIAWYNELIEKANKEAINQAYLKGYEDGHRDGYNDCIREKEECNYKLPNVEDSKYDYLRELEEKKEEKETQKFYDNF